MTQTITGLFDTYDAATQAVRELEAAGIPHGDISIVANNADKRWSPSPARAKDAGSGAATGASVGAAVGGGAGLLAGLGMLAIPGLGPVVAAGWLAATAVGAAAGAAAGGLVGSLTAAGVSPEHAEVYAEGVRRGGSLVSARVSDQLAARARSILASRGSVDPGVRGAAYRKQGWSRFDVKAAPYTPSQIEKDRALYRCNAFGRLRPRLSTPKSASNVRSSVMNKNIQGDVSVSGSSEGGLEGTKDSLSDSLKSLTNEASEKVTSAVQDAYSRAKDAAAPVADKVTGAVQRTYDQARDAASTGAEVATRQIREKPLSSTLTLAATCFFVGWILGRK